ncbi:hypothetical protein ACIQMY_25555 [Streptomyces sp. NPDC091368]|uniref:hypothetical protein n=1 Tax=Streptomyces sp. NPDC091368 TaxID=3365993 RepID=UPI00382CC185
MIASPKPASPEVVRQTPVVVGSMQLTVSTIRIAHGHYDTVIFDDSPTRKHTGMLLGGFVIDASSKFASDRESAMNQHRAALQAARSEEPTEVAA